MAVCDMIAEIYERIRPQKKTERPKSPYALCESCARHGTMNCPNSSLCFALENKPYYQKK